MSMVLALAVEPTWEQLWCEKTIVLMISVIFPFLGLSFCLCICEGNSGCCYKSTPQWLNVISVPFA